MSIPQSFVSHVHLYFLEETWKPKVGDIVVARGHKLGIIVKISEETPDEEPEFNGVVWSKIMWSDGIVTWEDLLFSTIDRLFSVLPMD